MGTHLGLHMLSNIQLLYSLGKRPMSSLQSGNEVAVHLITVTQGGALPQTPIFDESVSFTSFFSRQSLWLGEQSVWS